jgi:hypothetical protein
MAMWIQHKQNCVDKKNQLDVTFCILYFSSNSCSACFGQPCARQQELTTAWCYSLVLVCAAAAERLSRPVGRYCVHGWVLTNPFVFFICLLIVAQHVSGNHVPVIRSWRLRDVIVLCWYVLRLREGCQDRLAGSASMDGFVRTFVFFI